MIKYNVFHIEFDVDDEFGDDWSISKSDFQDQLEEKYVGIWEADSKIDALVDSMGVTDEKVSPIHRRKDMDLL